MGAGVGVRFRDRLDSHLETDHPGTFGQDSTVGIPQSLPAWEDLDLRVTFENSNRCVQKSSHSCGPDIYWRKVLGSDTRREVDGGTTAASSQIVNYDDRR